MMSELSRMAVTTGPDPSLSVAFREHVRPCIDVIDKLRAFGLDTDVALPSVVFIGDQSAGKSSVLEAISGVQLPRGSGMVTRCPLELKLKSLSNIDHWKGRIKYRADGNEVVRDITKLVDVEEEVKRGQIHLAGTRKGISEELITLEIESANVPDLTLIDLPGITRVAVDDQPKDIGMQIKGLINQYIQKEHTIILAVVPASVDIATTEALQMAEEADPCGHRTLGVITKPDLADKGTEPEIIAVVTNQRYKLSKGYTMVKCRGQQAINDGQTLQDATDEENQYFTNHEQFKELEPSLFGVSTLAQKLTYVLVDHIKCCTPKLKQVIQEKLVETRKELDRIGAGLPKDINEKRMFLVKMVSNFATEIIQVSNGEYAGHQALLRLLARCRKEFDKFGETIAQCKPGTNIFSSTESNLSEQNQNQGTNLSGGASTANKSLFGTPATSASTTFSFRGFGRNAGTSLFGQQNQQPKRGVIGTATIQSGSGGLFGTNTATSTGFGTSRGFDVGKKQASRGLFGVKRTGFGQLTSNSGFGFSQQNTAEGAFFSKPATSTSSFGFAQNTESNLFEQNQNQGTNLFGGASTANKSLFGTPATSASTTFSFRGFGQTAGTSLFGQQNQQPYEGVIGTATIQSGSGGLFGTNTATSTGFGTSRGFDFENNQASAVLFGIKPTGFGQLTSNSGFGFGQQSTTAGALFSKPATSTPSFGFAQNTETNSFEQNQNQGTTLFVGAATANKSLFGTPATSASTTFSFRGFGQNAGTSLFGQQNQQPNKGAIGTATTQSGSAGLFGTNTATSTGFGTSGGFDFGDNQASGGLFVSKPTGFGHPTSKSGFDFGQQNTAAGASLSKPATSTSSFGFAQNTAFGTNTSSSTKSSLFELKQPQGTNLFGGAATANKSTFGTPARSATISSGSAGFGKNTRTSLFGHENQQPKKSLGLSGNKPTGFGQPSSNAGFYFGQQKTTGRGVFSKPGALTTSFGFGRNTGIKFGEDHSNLLHRISEELESQRGRELPRFMKFQVCESIIHDNVTSFIEPANECLRNIIQLIEFTLTCVASQHFECYPSLERQIKAVIDDLCQTAEGECDKALRKLFEIEKLVYTQDKTYTTELDTLLEKDSGASKVPLLSRPTSRFDEARSLMTFVCSYLQVATRRLADVVPMIIRYHLLKQLPEEIKNTLLVNASGDDMLDLLCENKTILQRREMLKQRQNRLKLACKELAKL